MGDSRRWGMEREEEERERRERANHPTIHCNRIEPAGNYNSATGHYELAQKPATLPKGVAKNFGAHLTIPEDVLQRAAQEFPNVVSKTVLEPSHEPHGAGSHELPDVVSPEEWIDRYTHLSATKAIILLEAGFVRSVPQESASGNYIDTTIDMDLDGRVWDIVKQKYTDVGWKNVTRGTVDPSGGPRTHVTLYFP